MLGVNMKNTNIPLPMNNVLVFFDTLTLPYSNHKPKKIASPYVQNNMGFIMIIQLNAWWHEASIHCDFDTLQNKTKKIIIDYNIYH